MSACTRFQSSFHTAIQVLDLARRNIIPFSTSCGIELSKCNRRNRARMYPTLDEVPNILNRVEVWAVNGPTKAVDMMECFPLTNLLYELVHYHPRRSTHTQMRQPEWAVPSSTSTYSGAFMLLLHRIRETVPSKLMQPQYVTNRRTLYCHRWCHGPG